MCLFCTVNEKKNPIQLQNVFKISLKVRSFIDLSSCIRTEMPCLDLTIFYYMLMESDEWWIRGEGITRWSIIIRDSLLQVRSGRDSGSPLLGTYCGALLPNPIFSQNNELYLRFKSDGATSRRGYEIIWTSSPSGKTCALWKAKQCKWEEHKASNKKRPFKVTWSF